MSSPTKILQISEQSSELVSIEGYLATLVASMPKAVANMFYDGRARFECTEDGLLGWRFEEGVPQRVQREASVIITRWTRKNPLDIHCEVI